MFPFGQTFIEKWNVKLSYTFLRQGAVLFPSHKNRHKQLTRRIDSVLKYGGT